MSGFIPKHYVEELERLEAYLRERERWWEEFVERDLTFTGPIVIPTVTKEGEVA